jgi:hypothetical protein
MITEAYLVGSLEFAFYKEDDQIYTYKRDDSGEFTSTPQSERDLININLNNPEIDVYTNIEWNFDTFAGKFEDNMNKKLGLDWFLMFMDQDFSESLRTEFLNDWLIPALKNETVKEFVINRVFGTSVPEKFDPLMAANLAKKFKQYEIQKLYLNLNKSKSIIADVRNNWLHTLLEFPQNDMDKLDKVFTDSGIFSDIVLNSLNNKDVKFSKYKDLLIGHIDLPEMFLDYFQYKFYKIID